VDPKLSFEAYRYQCVKERLTAEYPQIDDDTLADTLEGITDLHEMIAAVIRSALVDEALQTGLRHRLDEMRKRLSRLDLRAEKKRQLAFEAMSAVGVGRLEQPDFTASTRSGSPALIVIAEENIPSHYWVPQPPKLDRQKLLTDLKHGGAIAGAQLSNTKPILMVRTK
jgi:hypothetical protein